MTPERDLSQDGTPVALVIGGTGAIGGAIVARLAEEGLAVIAAGRGSTGAGEAPRGAREFLTIDVADAGSVADGFQKVIERHGRLDLLVNASGGAMRMNLILRMSPEDWERQHAVHSRGEFLASQQAAKVMRKARQGRIVNIASIAAIAPVRPGYSAYAASKAAMASLTRCLNQELNQYGVQATALCPTYVDSPAWDQAGADKPLMLQPTDVADAVLFLWRLPPRVRVETLELETPVA